MATSLQDIKDAGLLPYQPSATDQLMQFVSGVPAAMKVQQAENVDKQNKQLELYQNLRNAGYSSDEAHSRVSRSFGPTDFLQRMLTGDSASAFAPPATAGAGDPTSLAIEKTKADISKTKAETGMIAGREAWYRGTGRQSGGGRTPDPVLEASRLRGILDGYVKRTYPMMSGTDREQMKNDPTIAAITKKMNSLTGIDPTSGGPGQPHKVGATVTYKGKPYTVAGYNQDGTVRLKMAPNMPSPAEVSQDQMMV